MKFSLHTTLPCTLSDAWDALHNPEVFQAVSKPFLYFTPVDPPVFPLRYQSKHRYVVAARALGIVPLGEQEINPLTSSEGDQRTFIDNGRGRSGMLGMVTTFRHQMTLRPSGKGGTILIDQLEFSAGALSPLLWVSFRVFWWWRHLRMRALVPQWHNLTTAAWESRYAKKSLWSGSVNQTLVGALEKLTPGTALDVGAGEGADALWLAERGFHVTALDASPSALMRAEAERVRRVRADGQAREVRWVASDILTDDFPATPREYDLVVAHFLHLPKLERAIIWRKLVAAVAPGGSLLIVGHSPQDLSTGVQRPLRDLMFSAEELRKAVPSSWKKVQVSETIRTHSGTGDPSLTLRDIVLFATR